MKQHKDEYFEGDDGTTMVEEEVVLMEKYMDTFGETPPIAFLHPDTSIKLMKDALKTKTPFNEKDIAALPDE